MENNELNEETVETVVVEKKPRLTPKVKKLIGWGALGLGAIAGLVLLTRGGSDDVDELEELPAEYVDTDDSPEEVTPEEPKED